MKRTHVRYPDGHVLLRNLTREYPVISHGEGPYLYDRAGKRYFDGSGGAMVMSIGHGVREVTDRIADQIRRVAYVNGQQFTNEPAEELAERLGVLAQSFGKMRSAFLASGSEAIEAAVKFARQLHFERGETERHKLIARVPSYHGNTLYALSAGGRKHYKKYYGPLLSEVITTPAPTEYRSAVHDYATDGAEYYARALEEAIVRAGPKTVSAFIVEPVIGSSAGAATPPPGYFERVQEVCRRHGVLVIADEILCGAGRSGKFFASSLYGLNPDLIVLGKGINGGYAALSVVMVREEHLAEMKKGTGYFMHAQTYLQAPCMAIAGVAVLDYMQKNRVLENACTVGSVFQKRLREEILPLRGVGHIAGVGMLAGVEFVCDRVSKSPFPRAEKKAEALVAQAFQNGLIVWPNVGHVDDQNGDLVMLAPPLNASITQVEECVTLLADSIRAVF
jgi:adenosylmethionine-8-amino-7-oxononanoate aminotransferase